MTRNWTDDSGLAVSAANLNAMEADITAALGVPDAALAARVQAGATKTALDARYATNTALEAKEPLLPEGGVTQFLRGDRTWQEINVSGDGGSAGNVDPVPREFIMDPTNVWGPDGTKLVTPTHVEPAGGQVVHPSVVFVPGGWNGYKYWMAITAYPGGNDDHEDPNILASHDGITWVVPEGLTNPIADADGTPEYHSDTDLKMGPNNTMYLFFRWYEGVTGSGTEEHLKFSKSIDGINWTEPQSFYVSNEATRRLLSPSLIFEDNRWTMYAVDMVPSPNPVVRLKSENADLLSTWSEPEVCTWGTLISGREPWHIYVTKTGGRYYALLNDRMLDGGTGGAGDVYFLSSSNGLNFTSSGVGIIPKAVTGKHAQLYQSTMTPAVEGGNVGFRVWYTGWHSDNTWWLYRTFISEGRWKALTLENAWVNYVGGGGYAQTGLRYKTEGRSGTIDGAVRSGAVGTVITTLPLAATPYHTFMVPVNAGGTVSLLQIQGKINTAVAGQVIYFSGPAAPSYVPFHFKYDLD